LANRIKSLSGKERKTEKKKSKKRLWSWVDKDPGNDEEGVGRS
jgi:hypothetical protein